MEWIERFNNAISYIEKHITEEIDYEQVAKVACCSSYHFQRMFNYLADVPISEYIRRRKLSLAAVDLQSGNEKVIDIALKYGYSSPTAFNRAFQSIHGVTPSSIKVNGQTIKSFPPINFKIIVKGVEEMNFRIEKKDAFRIVGVSAPLEKELEKNFEIVPKMWEKVMTDGTIIQINQLLDTDWKCILGVSVCDDCRRTENYENWRYYIAAPSTLDKGMFDEYIVPALTWAIFSGKGSFSQDLPELERRVITEWLPTSGYEYDNGPDIEVYLTPDIENAEFEIWIPVKKKVVTNDKQR